MCCINQMPLAKTELHPWHSSSPTIPLDGLQEHCILQGIYQCLPVFNLGEEWLAWKSLCLSWPVKENGHLPKNKKEKKKKEVTLNLMSCLPRPPTSLRPGNHTSSEKSSLSQRCSEVCRYFLGWGDSFALMLRRSLSPEPCYSWCLWECSGAEELFPITWKHWPWSIQTAAATFYHLMPPQKAPSKISLKCVWKPTWEKNKPNQTKPKTQTNKQKSP